MRKRRKVLVVLGLIAMAAVCFVVLRPRDEPKYQGRYLSEWMEAHQAATIRLDSGAYNPAPTAFADLKEAERAVQAIGTNALPCLLEWTAYELPAWKEKLIDKLPTRLAKNESLQKIVLGRGNFLSEYASVGFELLGPNAASAIPQLELLMNDAQRSDSAVNAAYALEGIVSPAVPVLTNALANPTHQLRHQIASALGRMAVRAGLAETNLYLPVLLQCCNDANANVRYYATNVLGPIDIQVNQNKEQAK